MNRKSFAVVVAAVVIFLAWIVIAGNRLPSNLRSQIVSERRLLDDARKSISADREQVSRIAQNAPELFKVRGFDREWPSRFTAAQDALATADSYAGTLEQLRQKNSRGSRSQVEDLLAKERQRRASALDQAASAVREARKRADFKRDFPQTLARIDATAKNLASADYTALVPKIEKAEQDWPAKKEDLQNRLNTVLAPRNNAAQWQQTVASLQSLQPGQMTADNYAKALELSEDVDRAPGPAQAREVVALSQQLYTSWDNVLEDLDKDDGRYREKVKHVSTTVPAPGVPGTTVSENLWKDIPREQWQRAENNIGMTIDHKPLGKYDTEADRTPQPAGFAYMATPAEGRNQYGYWESRGGNSVWTWLPQYLILRDLLSNRSYVPVPSYDWNRYRDAQRYGKTYYGNESSGAPKYGSHGTFTLQRYGSSRYVQSGGFSGSKYGTGGGFSGSRYGGNAPSASSSSSSSGKRFGSSAGPSPRRYGGSSGGMRFGSGRSAGRSFGGGRRR